MYKLSGKLKLFSIIFMVVGALGIGYGFLTAPSTTEDAKEMLASHEAHGDDHAAMVDTDHGGDQHDQAGSKSSKNTCCQDYCGVTVIDCGGVALTHPRLEPVHALLDDVLSVGLAPRLHLPPNI